MKKLILIAVLFLCSCALLKGPAPFDNNEYALINKVYTLSEVYKIDCGDLEKTKANFSNLAEISMELVNYSSDVPDNLDTVNLVIPLHKMISNANIKFKTETHGITYCKLKLDNIETSAGIVKAVVAKRKRI